MLTDNKTKENAENVLDLDLSEIRKKRFRIDEDNNRILELNTSDAGIISRLNEYYPKMQKLAEKMTTLMSQQDEESDEKEVVKISKLITDLDKELREFMDKLFDAPVSEVCMPFGTAIDPYNGEFTFEIIIRKLSQLYENNFNSEFAAMKKKVAKHTAKYTKPKRKK